MIKHLWLSSFIVILGIFLISSCKTNKNLIVPKDHLVSKQDVYNSIFDKKNIDWFSGKAKIKVTDNNGSQRATMYVRMKSDSVIWIVIKKHSLEAARALITKDSLSIIYRFEKTYQVNSLDSLSSVFGMLPDFNFLQQTLVGSIPQVDTTRLWQQKESIEEYNFRSIYKNIILDFNFNKITGYLSSGKFYERSISEGSWTYSEHNPIEHLILPYQRKFHVNFDEENYFDLEIDFNDIEINTPYEINFSIPDHYLRVN